MEAVVIAFLQSHPQLSVLLTVVTVLKAVFHPLMTVLENAVVASGNAKALSILQNAEASSGYKTIVWAVDYLTSIDLSTVSAAITAKQTPPPAT